MSQVPRPGAWSGPRRPAPVRYVTACGARQYIAGHHEPNGTMERMERDGALTMLRRILLLILLFTMAGTVTELFLLEHTDSRTQWVPIVCIGLGLVLTTVALLRPGRGTLRAVQLLMAVFLLAGLAGLYFHLTGNLAFEREVHPENTGWTLWKEALFGATPLLAPGAMIQMGLVGLAATWRHPHLQESER